MGIKVDDRLHYGDEGTSELEATILNRKSDLYVQLSIAEKRNEALQGEIVGHYADYTNVTDPLKNQMDMLAFQVASLRTEIEQANLALHAIGTGVQES